MSCYDIKPLDDKALDNRGMWSITSLSFLPGPLWPGVVAPDMVFSMGQMELFEI